MSKTRVGSFVAALAAGAMLLPAGAHAQAAIKVNDNVSLRFGVLVQAWADLQQDAAANQNYQQNIFLRRARLLFGGQVAPRVTFFVETDAANLGRVSGNGAKGIAPTVILQDAWAEYKVSDALQIDGGLMLIPLCRNCLQSAATLLPLDYGAYTFTASTPTQSTVGRDVGVQAKGYLLENRVEYRAGLFQGLREGVVGVGNSVAGRNAFRVAGRVQVNLLEPEVTPFFYTGTYLGKKRVLAIGAGIDAQQDYTAYAVDGFFDHPVGTAGDGFTLQGDFIHFDGGNFLAIAKQNTFYVETGYYNNASHLMPFASFGTRSLSNAPANNTTEDTRFQLGLGWMPSGHNANVKLAWNHVSPKNTTANFNATNELTVQLQAFYY